MERESHLIMKEIIKHKITHNVNRLKTSLKWVVFAILSGVLVGSVGTLFYLCMALVTLVRTKNPWLIFLLPVGGILIVGAYRLLHDERDIRHKPCTPPPSIPAMNCRCAWRRSFLSRR